MGKKPLSRQRLRLLPKGLTVLGRLLWHVGTRGEGDYRGTFWCFALPLLVSKLNASRYSVNLRESATAVLEAAE